MGILAFKLQCKAVLVLYAAFYRNTEFLSAILIAMQCARVTYNMTASIGLCSFSLLSLQLLVHWACGKIVLQWVLMQTFELVSLPLGLLYHLATWILTNWRLMFLSWAGFPRVSPKRRGSRVCLLLDFIFKLTFFFLNLTLTFCLNKLLEVQKYTLYHHEHHPTPPNVRWVNKNAWILGCTFRTRISVLRVPFCQIRCGLTISFYEEKWAICVRDKKTEIW